MKLIDRLERRPLAVAFDMRRSGGSAVDPTQFASRTAVAAAGIDPGAAHLRTAGYDAAGDGGGALYSRAGSEPPHAGKVQSADGAWWELVMEHGRVSAAQFGAFPSASAAVNTAALAAASGFIEARGGGELVVPPGTYTVGNQTRNGTDELGQTSAWVGDPLISVENCTGSVRIIGNGAVLKAAAGLHYGSFDPTTGNRYDPASMPFTDIAYAGWPYRAMISLVDNESVHVEGIELDGNAANLDLGGTWGAVGRQLTADGLFLSGNRRQQIVGVTSHDHGRDGAQLAQPGLTHASPPRPVHFVNLSCRRNGRNNFSLVGGKQVVFDNPDFCFAGTVVNAGTGETLGSAPMAGIDFEAEGSVVDDIVLNEPNIQGNANTGFLIATGNGNPVEINGGLIETWYGTRRCRVTGTTLVGWGNYKISYAWDGNAAAPGDGHHFRDCLITYDVTLLEAGAFARADALNQIAVYDYDVFEDCRFDIPDGTYPPSAGFPVAANMAVMRNCIWKVENNGAIVTITGRFQGINTVTTTGTGDVKMDFEANDPGGYVLHRYSASAGAAPSFNAQGGGASATLDYGRVTMNGAGLAPPFTLANVTTDRTFDADAATITETNDVLATLINRAKQLGIVD